MKKSLTNNLGLKVLAVLAAAILWLVVVNMEDPVITRTYSGIPVTIINDDVIKSQNKTYEVLDNSDTTSVSIRAKRSIHDQIGKNSTDYIRATADMKNLTDSDTVPIDISSTRFEDRIEFSPRGRNLKLRVEDVIRKRLYITVESKGAVNEGSMLGPITPDVNILSITGPASLVESIVAAKGEIDVTGLSKDISTVVAVNLYDADDNRITDPMLKSSVTEVHVTAQILETKEVDVFASTSGTPADGYGLNGVVNCSPSRIRVAGRGSDFSSLSRIVIPDSAVSVAGAREDVVATVSVTDYLPDGIRLADEGFDGNVEVHVQVEQLLSISVDVPVDNISVINVPNGYIAHLAESGGTKRIEIQGISTMLTQVDPQTITGVIDAATLTPRAAAEGEEVQSGAHDGPVTFTVPTGITTVGQVYMEVILNPIGETAEGGE